jgi:hypothetical protein
VKPSIGLAILIGTIALVVLAGCGGGSATGGADGAGARGVKDSLLERATEAYKHVDGSESGWPQDLSIC